MQQDIKEQCRGITTAWGRRKMHKFAVPTSRLLYPSPRRSMPVNTSADDRNISGLTGGRWHDYRAGRSAGIADSRASNGRTACTAASQPPLSLFTQP